MKLFKYYKPLFFGIFVGVVLFHVGLLIYNFTHTETESISNLELVQVGTGPRALAPIQGGTGTGTVAVADVGKYLKISDDSPFTYSFDTPAGGSGGSGVGWATTSDNLRLYNTEGAQIVLSANDKSATTTSDFLNVYGSIAADYFNSTSTTRVSTFPRFTSTNSTTTNATTTNFAISGITSSILKTGSDGSVQAAVSGTDYAITSSAMTGTFDGNNFAGGAIGAGDILYGASAGSITELAIGASSTVLLSNGTAPLWLGTSTLGLLANANIDTCAELAAIIAGETGTCGSLVFSADPTFTGLTTYATLNGTSATSTNLFATRASTTNATSTNLNVSNSLNFGGVAGTAWADFCTSITGGAGLCDGTDATGGGGSGSNWSNFVGFISPSTTVGFTSNASSSITDLSVNRSTTTNASSTNLFSTRAILTFSTSTNIFSTNASATNLYANILGVGTSTPKYSVVVASDTPYLALSDNNAAANTKNWIVGANNGIFSIGTTTDSNSATSTALSITAGSGLHVGTTTSSATGLAVQGTVFVNGRTVSTVGNAVCHLGSSEDVDAGGTTCVTSSERFKTDILDLPKGTWKELLQLDVKDFNYKEGYTDPIRDKGGKRLGIIAEQMEKIDPRLVQYDAEGRPQSVHFDGIIALLIQAVQEQGARRTAEENWQWAVMILLGAGLVFQQIQINRMKHEGNNW